LFELLTYIMLNRRGLEAPYKGLRIKIKIKIYIDIYYRQCLKQNFNLKKKLNLSYVVN